jgi:hypothetical protein
LIWVIRPVLPEKIFPFAATPNQNYIYRRLAPLEGRIAVVTDAGRDAVDASGASDEGACLRTAKSCGSDASTLAFKFAELISQATVTTKPDRREEHEGNRKTIAQGMSDCLR